MKINQEIKLLLALAGYTIQKGIYIKWILNNVTSRKSFVSERAAWQSAYNHWQRTNSHSE